MLLTDPVEPVLDVILAIEDDGALQFGMRALAALRRAGLSADMIASGSPKKRFDKAVKAGATVLGAITLRDGQPAVNLRGAEDVPTYVTAQQVFESLLD
jgi:histidyl-tRNA synthetase